MHGKGRAWLSMNSIPQDCGEVCQRDVGLNKSERMMTSVESCCKRNCGVDMHGNKNKQVNE